ncbi:MAG: GNAT family N-acetyltransferase [Gammaproteobacteria bacterium]
MTPSSLHASRSQKPRNTVVPSGALRATLVGSESAFHALAAQWDRLVDGMEDTNVFLRHEWFDAAWQWAKCDAELWLVRIDDGQRLVGLAPLVRRQPRTRLGPMRELSFLTVPDTQYCDVLTLPRDRPSVLDALVRFLHETRKQWDVVRLTYLQERSATLSSVPRLAAAAGLRWCIASQGRNPGLSLAGTWSDYYGRRSRRLKKGNNLIANRLRRGGIHVRVERYTSNESRAEEMASVLHAAADLSGRSWKDQLGVSLSHAGPRAWFERLNEHAIRAGWLSLWLLWVDNQPAAMEYQLQYNGCVHALRSDFDPAFDEYSPGTYLHWKMLEALFDTDATLYQMGPGNNPYKYRWAELFDPMSSLTIYSSTLIGRWLALRDQRLRPLARRLRAYRESLMPTTSDRA